MNATAVASPGPLEFLRALWKQKACWVLLWLLASAAVLGAVRLIPPRYVAEATLTLEPARSPGRPLPNWAEAELRARLEVARLKVLRRERLLELLRHTYPELVAKWRPEEALVRAQQWRPLIRIRTTPESRGPFSAVHVVLEGADGAKGAALVNELARGLAQEFGELRTESAEATFWEKRAAEARRRLAECQDLLEGFEREHGREWAERERSLQAERSRLVAELASVERALPLAEQARARLERALNQLRATAESARAETRTSNPSPAAKESDMRRDVRERLAVLLVRYKEDHPDVRRLRAEIAVLEGRETNGSAADRNAESANGGQPDASHPATPREAVMWERARGELDRAQQKCRELAAERQRLSLALIEVEESLAQAAQRRRRHAALVSEYELAQSQLRVILLARQRSEEGAARAQESRGVRLVLLEEALATSKPLRPDRRLLGLLGALAALLPCAVVAAGRELGARSVLSVLGLLNPAPNGFQLSPTTYEQAPQAAKSRTAQAG